MKIPANNTDHIGVEFKVWAPLLNRVTKKLFLLGSLKELGAWDVDKALQAFPTLDMHTWNVEVSVPAMSQFEWAWLTTNLNRSGLEWEKPNRRTRTVDCCSGTLHTIYGDIDEVFLQSATCLEVTTYMRVEEGLTMVLTGSTPSTGEWDLRYSKKATEFPQRSGFWKAHVAFDALTNLEFKWTIVKEKDQGVPYLQEKLPHSVFGRRTWLRAVAPWNTPHVIVIDTSLLCDLPDTVMGRTEIIVKEHKRKGQEIKNWLTKAESDKEIATSPTAAAAAAKSPWYAPNSMERLIAIVPLSSIVQAQRMPQTITPPIQTPSVMSVTHVPSVQRTLDLDEHIRQRQDSLSKPDRLTQQLSKAFKEENTVYSIKGTGQTQLASDKLNTDLSVGTSEGIIRAYGEVAEMTSVHLSSYMNKQRCSMIEIHELQEKCGKQSRERSLTKVQKNEMITEGESQQMKAVCDEDEAVVVGSGGGTQEIMPLCVTSQTIADTVPSDTGFTELSSWMSSTKTDMTASESALISSHTMTCLLGADTGNASDGEESQSDQAIISSRRSSNPADGVTSYWETQQNDLSSPWLDKALARVQGGSGDFMSDCLDAMEDDYEHLEWLSCKLEEQAAYEMERYGTGLGTTFQVPADDAFKFTQGKISPVQASNHSKWSPSSPPKASPKTESPLGVTGSNDDIRDRDMFEGSSEKGASTTGHYLPSGCDFVNCEDDEISERRSIARIIEAQWGASYHKASEGQTGKDIIGTDLPYRKNGAECNDTSCLVFGEGLRYLLYSEGKKNKATYYSFDELSDMLLPDSDAVDHRARAREAEKRWGSRLGGEISSVQ